MSFDNVINGIARPLIGFFAGMALAYTFQLAQSAGWVFALGWLILICLLFGIVLLIDRASDRFFDWIGWGLGVKSAKRRAAADKPHWFVRFGWIFGLSAGFAAVFVLPEEVLSWL